MSDEGLEQLTLWGEIYPHFKIDKKLRLIELFSGVGSLYAACNVLFKGDKTKFESWRTCEWAYNSYCAYNSIHIKDFKDYSKGKTKEELIKKVYGTSTDYNNPLSLEQLKRKPIEWLQSAYNNIVATKNMVNIMNIHAEDLGIEDTKNNIYLLSYSFPCQDLSNSGKGRGCEVSQASNENQGMVGEGTRSGLLWEVDRLLNELNKMGKDHLPQILLLENVDALLSKNHIHSYKKWVRQLEKLGYTTNTEVLNGIDYGIPQTRKRVFAISILGKYAYDFPKRLKIKHKLKDFLEKKVDEKYYLSAEQIKRIANWKAQQKPLEEIPKHVDYCPTITARGAGEEHSGMILIDENLFEDGEVVDFNSSDDFRRLHNSEECPSLVCHSRLAIVEKDEIPIKNNTQKGYTIAKDGDGIDIGGRMEYHRGTVQKGVSQTITTKGGNDIGVVEEVSLFTDSELALITPDLNIRRYINSDIIDEFKDGQVATTSYPNGYGHGPRTHNDCIALNTIDKPIVKQGLRIRKLVPCECWKLMGFTKNNFNDLIDMDYNDNDLYHMAGDSIIVCHNIALLSPMIYDHDSHIKIINDYVEEILKGE